MLRIGISFVAAAISLPLASTANAQGSRRIPGPPVDEPFLLNLQTFNTALGIGARALGMGGAFVAVADDATAASWNPAGLAFLTRPEVSIVGETATSSLATMNFVDTVLSPDYSFQTRREPVTDQGKASGVSFVSVAYPFRLDRQRLTVQLSYQRLVRGLSADTSAFDAIGPPVSNAANFDPSYTTRRSTRVDARGGIDTITLGVGSAVSSRLTLGLALNYWFGSPQTTRATSTRLEFPGDPPQLYTDTVQRTTEKQSISAASVNAGVIWRPVPWMSLAAVYRSGWAGRVDSTYVDDTKGQDTVTYSPPGGPDEQRFERVDYHGETRGDGSLSWPGAFAIGVALRPVPALVVSFDFTRQEWSRASIDVARLGYACTNDGTQRTCRVNGTPGFQDTAAGAGEYTVHVQYPTLLDASAVAQRSQNSIRVGAEWVVFLGHVTVPVRAGAYQIDSISPYFEAIQTVGSSQRQVPAVGSQRLRGVTLGAGVGIGGLTLDAAWVRDTSSDDREQVDQAFRSGRRELTNTRFVAAATFRF